MTNLTSYISINVTQAKRTLHSLINRLKPGERIYLTQKGKVVAFIEKAKQMEIF